MNSESSIVDDDGSYFDEVVLDAWYNFLGQPIADTLPETLAVAIYVEGTTASNRMDNFHFINDEKFTFEKLKSKDVSEAATYAMVLKNIYFINSSDTGEMLGLLGWDYITDTPVIVAGGFSGICEGGNVLVFGEYTGFDSNDIPTFNGILLEDITNLFSKEELERDAAGLDLSMGNEAMTAENLGTIGSDISVNDLINMPTGKEIIIRGDFLHETTVTGIYNSLLYVDENAEKNKYILFGESGNTNIETVIEYGLTETDINNSPQFRYYYMDERVKEVPLEVTGVIDKIDAYDNGLIVCYMQSLKMNKLRSSTKTKDVTVKKQYSIGDTIDFNGNISFKIIDAGIQPDYYGASELYINVRVKNTGETLDACDWIKNVNFYGDDYVLASSDDAWLQINGENAVGMRGSYELRRGEEATFRFYAPCDKIKYDSAEKVVAEFNSINNALIVLKGSVTTDINVPVEEVSGAETQDYILQYSDSQYIGADDLLGLTAEECRIARNEIYARHGRIFADESLQAYFEALDWYYPQYTAEEFDDSMLNEYEIANRDFIVGYEKAQGYR